jgi:hypothetical protein
MKPGAWKIPIGPRSCRSAVHSAYYSPGEPSARYGRSTWKQPRVKANGNGPGSLVRYSPSKNTIARFGICSSNWKDGFHGPECHPRSSAVMIWIGELHSESVRDGRSALHHHKTSLRRGCALPDPNAREDRVESNSPLTNAEIEHLHFRRRKDNVFAPAGTPVVTLCITLDEIILVVRSGHVPHSPFTIVIDQVWFEYASVLPVFIRGEGRFGLIDPVSPSHSRKPMVYGPQRLSAAPA